MTTTQNFHEWLRHEVTLHVGPLEQISLAKAFKALFPEKTIDRETFRKILKENYTPSPAVQKRIREALQRSKAKRPAGEAGTPSGFQTRHLVAGFYNSNPYYEIEDSPAEKPDVLLRSRMSRNVLLIRCLEDVNEPSYRGLDYFRDFIDRAAKDIADRKCDEVTLITQHRLNPGETDEISARHRRVQVVSIGEFVARFFTIETQRRLLRESLKVAGLLEEKRTLPIPGLLHNPAGEIADVFHELVRRVQTPGPQLCVVLGQFGSGKTTLFQRTCLAMLPADGAHARLPLPVLVCGRDILSAEQTLEVICDALRSQYGYQLPEPLVRGLLRDGHLVVFIDALDEARVLLDMPSLELFVKSVIGLDGHNAKLFMSLRRELFATPEMEDFALKELDRIYLKALDASAAFKAVEFMTSIKLTAGSELPAELAESTRELAPTPLFLNMVSNVVAERWPRLQAIAANPRRRASGVYELFKEYTRQWVNRENVKALPRSLGLSDDDRIKMCERLAVLSMDPTLEGGRVPYAVLREEVKFQYTSEEQLDPEETAVRFEDFVRDIQLSSFLVREPKTSDFFFSHSSFCSYFLARALTKEIMASLGKSFDLGSVTLRRNDQILPVFIYARLSESQPDVLELVRRKLDSIRGSMSRKLGMESERLAVAAHNLCFIYCSLARLEGSKELLDLDGVYAPFLRFDDLASEIGMPSFPVPIRLGKANVEYSFAHKGLDIEPRGSGRFLGPIQYSGSHTPRLSKKERIARIGEILEYCWDCGLLQKDKYVDERGFEWCVLPGGTISVPRFGISEEDAARYEKAGPRLERRSDMASVLVGMTEIVMPSYLMMRTPVTNAQFLEFVRVESNSKWLAEHHRIEAKNDYYLRGWTGIAHEMGFGQDARTWDLAAFEGQKAPERWRRAPVVYVTWLAAHAFATYHGLSLPTEAHYSTAGSLFQEDDCQQTASVGGDWDHPWGSGELKGYALFAYQADQALIPTFDCTSLDEQGLELFAKWARAQPLTDKLVPLHLTGGVREWTTCAWEQHWPLSVYRQNDHYVSPKNDGLTLVNGRPRRVRFHREVLPYYSLRGGSFQLSASEARISYRAPMGASNCNPDCGFRCVKALTPKV